MLQRPALCTRCGGKGASARLEGHGGAIRALAVLPHSLATFTTTAKRPPPFPAYRHDRLRESFEPVIRSLRESLSKVLVQNAIPIPIMTNMIAAAKRIAGG